MTKSIQKFKKVFPEYADLSQEESIALLSSIKEKRRRDKWIEKRVKSYEKHYQ